MGHLHATEAASLMDLDTGLAYHLQSNHFPPVNLVFIPVAKEAIRRGVLYMVHEVLVEEAPELLLETVVMPNGIEKSYDDIIRELHLDAFVEHGYLEATGEFEEE